MRIELNGKALELEDGSTLEAAVRESGVGHGARGVAVAVEGEVVPRAEWPSRRLAEGERVEVLAAIQGGAR